MSQYERLSPLRSVRWRWDKAKTLIDSNRRPGRGDDRYVHKARSFMLYRKQLEMAETRYRQQVIFQKFPHFQYAAEIDAEKVAVDLRISIQARLLAGQTDEEIAEVVGVHAKCIEAYEAVFYCVRDRLQYRDWVRSQCLLPSLLANNGKFTAPECMAKMFGYWAGPVALEFVLSGHRNDIKVTGQSDLTRYFDEVAATRLRQRVCASTNDPPITSDNYAAILTACNQFKDLDLRARQLGAAGASNDYESAIVAMMGEAQTLIGVADTRRQRVLVNGEEVEIVEPPLLALTEDERAAGMTAEAVTASFGMAQLPPPEDSAIKKQKAEMAEKNKKEKAAP